jgi:hypothetical protein
MSCVISHKSVEVISRRGLGITRDMCYLAQEKNQYQAVVDTVNYLIYVNGRFFVQ